MQTKQVIVVRKDLHMKKGKLAAQVAHASLGAIISVMSREDVVDGCDNLDYSVDYLLSVHEDSPIEHWLMNSFKKVVLEVESEDELLAIYDKVKDTQIPSSLITDSGFTVFHGVPTNTCVAIGPAREEDIDAITGHLKLM